MPYNNNIPLATDRISDSQPLILQNFQALNSFGNGYCLLTQQGGAPGVAATEIAVYGANYPTTATNELFVRKPVTNIPLSASVLSNFVPMADEDGWSYLPSGIIFKWGVRNSDSAVNNLNTGGQLGPNFNQILNLQVTPRVSTVTTFRGLIVGTNSIQIVGNASGACYFFAIGR